MTNYSHYISQNATITMTAAEFMWAIEAAKKSVAIDPESAAYKAGRKDEQDYIIDTLESLAYTDEQGHEIISEFKSDLIALLKEEYK